MGTMVQLGSNALSENYAEVSAATLAAQMRAGRVKSRDLLEYFLDRVARFNPEINAVVVDQSAEARRQADAADAAASHGGTLGVLHGVPMTIKESFDIIGLPSTFGTPALANNIAHSNAVVVDRLLAAGAIIFGKTNVPLALGDFQSYNEIYGTTRNPWDLSRTPGGSSGGATAALAAGLTALEFGSDIGGSLRNPAHYCGVYAHKPTYGIVPSRGHALPGIIGPNDINVCGPVARFPEDLALTLDVVAGPDTLQSLGWGLQLKRPQQKSIGDFRVALWFEEAIAPVDNEVRAQLEAVGRTLRKAGATVSETARPKIDPGRQHDIYMQLLRAVTTSRRPQSEFDEALAIAPTLSPDDRSHRGYYIRGMVQFHRQWLQANEERWHMRMRWLEFFHDFDLLLCPASPVAAFPIDESPEKGDRLLEINGARRPYMQAQLFWSGLVGCCYLPSTVAPIGKTSAGLPVGAQIVGPEMGDHTTIEFARLLANEVGGFSLAPRYR